MQLPLPRSSGDGLAAYWPRIKYQNQLSSLPGNRPVLYASRRSVDITMAAIVSLGSNENLFHQIAFGNEQSAGTVDRRTATVTLVTCLKWRMNFPLRLDEQLRSIENAFTDCGRAVAPGGIQLSGFPPATSESRRDTQPTRRSNGRANSSSPPPGRVAAALARGVKEYTGHQLCSSSLAACQPLERRQLRGNWPASSVQCMYV